MVSMIPEATWFIAPAEALIAVLVTALAVFVGIIVYTRIAGLRSFSKMSAFDFVTTVAIGSMMATTIMTKNPPLLQGLLGLAAVFVLQWVAAYLRRHTSWAPRLIDNEPVLLMLHGEILEDNLASTQVTRDDLMAKLREANALTFSQVQAVVLETTGDVSVLHGGEGAPPLDPEILSGVVGRERFATGKTG